MCPVSTLSLMSQFPEQSLKLKKSFFSSLEFSGLHTAEALAAASATCSERGGKSQEDGIHVIFRHNARNVEKSTADVPNMAHSLQLAVTEGSFVTV